MRSIEIKNIKIVKETVKKMTKKAPWGETTHIPSRKEVMEELPEEMFETWEGAYSEIENIIQDTIMNG